MRCHEVCVDMNSPLKLSGSVNTIHPLRSVTCHLYEAVLKCSAAVCCCVAYSCFSTRADSIRLGVQIVISRILWCILQSAYCFIAFPSNYHICNTVEMPSPHLLEHYLYLTSLLLMIHFRDTVSHRG